MSMLPKNKSLVVQKYVHLPHLINGLKFDIRMYVFVASFYPLRVYIYDEGLARFASGKTTISIQGLEYIILIILTSRRAILKVTCWG